MPGFDDFRRAEAGVVALGGCLTPDDERAFVCRTCELAWGSESDPTADEAELSGLLGVTHRDVIRALGAGWRREASAGGQEGVAWFVSGEPAQVAVGVQSSRFVLDRPLTSWDDVRPGPLMADGPRFTREDLLDDPQGVAWVAEDIASRRRRSFRWCRTCRRSTPPESFVGSQSACERCVRLGDPDG
ncbi:hypothetical protein [Blastococcus sp. TF02-09]|uniref:hypothetical protein n=1 Tax=Blastococcus sp. TF02-09 TaxID=2250576 RepID=UPI001F222FB5|nr:hypothetical protein [Blastococcus sp. TF02-9]